MASDPPELLNHENLLSLYSLYIGILKDELGFFFQYFHFYISLLSAILTVTITGLLSLPIGKPRGLALLVGPVLIVVLSRIGYNIVQTFYRRFTEAWVGKLNLESMLGLPEGGSVEPGIQRPSYVSRKGGFIPQIEWLRLKTVFDSAEENGWSAEELINRLVEVGTTLADARWTFILFAVVGIILAVVIIVIAM